MSDALIFVAGAAFGSILTAIGVTYWFNVYMYRKMIAWGWRWVYKGIREGEE
jgi:hypothetical protein